MLPVAPDAAARLESCCWQGGPWGICARIWGFLSNIALLTTLLFLGTCVGTAKGLVMLIPPRIAASPFTVVIARSLRAVGMGRLVVFLRGGVGDSSLWKLFGLLGLSATGDALW